METKSHADRLRAYAAAKIDPAAIAINWRGIALIWDGEEPVLDTVLVDDPDEVVEQFGRLLDDEGAMLVVASMPVDLLDKVSDAYLERAEEDGYRVSYDAATGEERLVRP